MSLEERKARERLQSLSPAVLLVVEQLLLGKTNAEIAVALERSVKTIKAHLTQIYRAAGCANVRQFLVWYFSGTRSVQPTDSDGKIAWSVAPGGQPDVESEFMAVGNCLEIDI